jgi:hypothetical protein
MVKIIIMRKSFSGISQSKPPQVKNKAIKFFSKFNNLVNQAKLKKKYSTIVASSLKNIHQQLESISFGSSTKFADNPFYMEGKKRLFFQSKHHNEEVDLLNLIKIIDNTDPNKKNFITPDIMKSKLTRKILQSRKRSFGSTALNSLKTEPDSLNYEGLDWKQSKILRKVLHINSCTISPINEKFENFQEKGKKTVKPLSLSPVVESFEKNDIDKDYFQALKKTDLENGLHKVRLSRLVSLKGVFKAK